jgi:TolA-binding protein
MKKIIILLSFAFLLSACSAGLESRMNRELRDMRSLQAEQSAAITDIRHDIRDLTGRLDEIQHHSQGKTSALESAIQQLGSRVPPPSGVPEHLLSLDDQRIAPIQGKAADKYRNALKLIRTGDFENSHIAFTSFAKENPGTAFTDNAFFWSGISSMKLGRYERAIGEFSDVFEKYPAEDMVAPSLYYMADSLFTLGMGNDGVLTLQKLVEDHPDSEFAAKARERLKESKSGRR